MKKKSAKPKPKTSARQKAKGCRRPSSCSVIRAAIEVSEVIDKWEAAGVSKFQLLDEVVRVRCFSGPSGVSHGIARMMWIGSLIQGGAYRLVKSQNKAISDSHAN